MRHTHTFGSHQSASVELEQFRLAEYLDHFRGGKKMWKKLLLTAVTVVVSASVAAQDMGVNWVHRHNPANNGERPEAMIADADGNIYVTGQCLNNNSPQEYFTIKYYPDGQVAWTAAPGTPVGPWLCPTI